MCLLQKQHSKGSRPSVFRRTERTISLWSRQTLCILRGLRFENTRLQRIKAQKYGNAVTSLPYNEQIFRVNPDDEMTTKEYIPRETLRRVSTPQAYLFKKLDDAYHEAFEKGIGIFGSAYTNTMMVELGETLHFAAGSDKNIKLTTKDDLELFKGYLKIDKDTWLK